MMQATYYCDGCGRKLEGESLELSLSEAVKSTGSTGEIFCPESCQAFTPDYRLESQALKAQVLMEVTFKLESFRRKFFQNRQQETKLKKVVAPQQIQVV